MNDFIDSLWIGYIMAICLPLLPIILLFKLIFIIIKHPLKTLKILFTISLIIIILTSIIGLFLYLLVQYTIYILIASLILFILGLLGLLLKDAKH